MSHGRSEGYGSLQIWIKYIQKGITYQPTYVPSDGCTKSGWTGAAFTIGGGYIWQDVYNEAFPRNLTVVGGGDPVSSGRKNNPELERPTD